MFNFAAKLAGAATLALAALPVAALTVTAAHAAPAPAHVRIGDLNLASAAGQKLFAERVRSAGETLCGDERALDGRAACMAGVRAEAHEKLAVAIQTRATTLAAR
jgi:UrcA family protein